MSNREKLFKFLEEKENEDLAEIIDLACGECPANSFCSSNASGLTCQESLYGWLEKEQE